MSHEEYESELTGSRDDIAAVLHGVADGVRAGRVRLGDDADAVAAAVPDAVSLEVELETEADEVELELELEWAAPSDEPAVAPAEQPPAADGTDADESRPPGTDDEPAGDDADADGAADGTVDDAAVDEPAAPERLGPALAGAADGAQSLARFELFRDRGDEWRWRLRHRNGNVIATSGEGYTRKHNARKGLRSVMANAPGAEVREPE